jgi:hypothetical protein
MDGFKAVRGLKPSTIFLAALSLSIGWGIRGNFGHEYGAMIPGALTAIAVCLLSGREDWRNRVAYFAMFGALGWGFGGSMSYMQVVAYTHSGQLASQMFGFFGLFVIGFLWAAMGGAGTAFPAVAEKERLTAIFRPLCWIFVFWIIFNKFVLYEMETLFPANYDPTWSRQAAYTYWFDSDWMEATAAIIALLAFELWDNRWGHLSKGKILFLPVLLIVGAFLGFAAQQAIQMMEWDGPISSALIHYQVTPEFVASAAAERGLSQAEVLSDQLINWPNVVLFFPSHIGWFVGALIGLGAYFFRFGRFGSGASLFMHMGLGWLGCFLLFPVLLGHPFHDGEMWFRMTPPRGDNWAGILGVVIGTAIWLVRNNYIPVLYAMVVSGIIGGLGFSGGQLIKLTCIRPGNREVTTDPSVLEQWAHWQTANWHSVLEQSYGFINGIAIAIAMGILAMRLGRNDGAPDSRPWTKVFAAAFVLFGVTYLNMFKNVRQWVKDDALPEEMALPLVNDVVWPAAVWFNIIFAVAALAGIALLARHIRQPIALVPATALGRGQLLYVAFVGTVAVMNFERALAGFAAGRLITEGVIFLNAILATVLILLLPRASVQVPAVGLVDYGSRLYRSLCLGICALLLATFGMTWIVRGLYGDQFSGHAGEQFRFGDEATWKTKPTEKSQKHS